METGSLGKDDLQVVSCWWLVAGCLLANQGASCRCILCSRIPKWWLAVELSGQCNTGLEEPGACCQELERQKVDWPMIPTERTSKPLFA